MELTTLSENLLTVLEEFDAAILPFGLYASNELPETNQKKKSPLPEWDKAIVPYLEQQNCSVYKLKKHPKSNQHHKAYQTWLYIPDLGKVNFIMLRFSKIKVRKYGSKYRVDNHESRSERWQNTEIGQYIYDLWKSSQFETGQYGEVLLLIGFDKAQNPLEKELIELRRSLQWEKKGVNYLTHAWEDKARRGFGIRLALWTNTMNSDQTNFASKDNHS
jgi:hypothetical protein